MAAGYDYTIKLGVDLTAINGVGQKIDAIFNKQHTLKIDTSAITNQIQSAINAVKFPPASWNTNGNGGNGGGNKSSSKLGYGVYSVNQQASNASTYSFLNSGSKSKAFDTTAYKQQLQEMNRLMSEMEKNRNNLTQLGQGNPNINKESKQYLDALEKQKNLQRDFAKIQSDLSKASMGKGTFSDLSKDLQGISNIVEKKDKVKEFIQALHSGDKIEFGNVSNDLQSITYSVKDAEGVVTTYTGSLDKLNGAFHEVAKGSNALSDGINKPFEGLKQSVGSYLAGVLTLQTAISAVKSGMKVVTEFDSGLTNISMTMNTTSSQLDDLGSKVIQSAKDIGTTISQSLDVSKIYANMQTTSDEIIKLTTPTIELSNASGIDTGTVSNYIQSVLRQFDMTADQSEHIADVYESISSNIQVDFSQGIKDIAEGVEAAGNIVHESGMSFETFAAIVGKTAETTRQSGSQIGRAWTTILTRTSKASGVSDDIDPATLSKAAESLHKIGIEVYDAQGNFNDIDDILGALAGKWDGLSDAMQAEISFNVAATRNRNILATALKNYSDIVDLATEAENANGLASRNQEKYMETYTAKLNIAKDEIGELAINLLDNDITKGMIDGFSAVLEVINKVLESTGKLGVAFAGIAGLAGIGGLGKLFEIKGIVNILDALKGIGSVIGNLSGLSSAANVFNSMGGGMQGLAAGARVLVSSINPVAAAVAGAVAAVSIGIGVFDLFTESFSETAKKADDAKVKYQETKSELENVDKELETTQTRISELEAKKGSLSFVEEAELERLHSVNEQLEAQKTMLETLATLQQGQAASTANKVLTGTTLWQTDEYTTNAEGIPMKEILSGDIIDKAKYQSEWIKNLTAEHDALQKKLSEYDESDMVSNTGFNAFLHGESNWDRDNRRLRELEAELQNARGEWAETTKTISEYSSQLYDENGNVIPGYEDTVNRINDVYKTQADSIEAAKEKQKEFNKEISDNNFDEAKNKLVDMAKSNKDVGITIDDIKENFKDFYDWISDASEYSLDDVVSNINSEAGVGAMHEIEEATDSAKVSIEEFSTTIDSAINRQNMATDALKSSTSATGLSTDEIRALTNAYGDLEGFDAATLFETTAQGVHLNKEALQELQEAANANTSAELYNRIADAQADLMMAQSIGADTSGIEAELQTLYQLEAQFDAATSAYNRFVNAQAGTDERDSLEGISKGYKSVGKLIKQGWVTDDEVTSYLDLMLGTDRVKDSEAAYKSLSDTISGTSFALTDFMTLDSSGNMTAQGAWNMVDALDELNQGFVTLNKDGTQTLDLTGDNLQKAADALGTTTDFVELVAKALSDSNMEVKFEPKVEFDAANASIDEIQAKIDELNSEKVKIESEGGDTSGIDNLISQLNKQYYIKLDAKTNGSLQTAAALVDELKGTLSGRYAFAVDVENSAEVYALGAMIANLDEEVQIAIGVDESNIGDAKGILDQFKNNPDSIKIPVEYEQKDIEEPEVNDIDAKINYKNIITKPHVSDISARIIYENIVTNPSLPPLTRVVNLQYNTSSAPSTGFSGSGGGHYSIDYNGTAYAFGSAYVTGSGKQWGIRQNEKALVNEIGEESIVRDGRFYLLSGGAHFEKLQRGDIVFNHKQTAELLKNGKIIANGGHGRIALADGTTYNAYSGVTATGSRPSSVTSHSSSSSSSGSNSSGNSSSSSSKSSASKSTKDTKELVDYIEIKINRIERMIKRFKTIADSAFKSWTKRATALGKEINKVTREIEVQKSGYKEYMSEANKIDLSSSIKKKIKNGSIDLKEYKNDDTTYKNIKKFKELYEKALDCKYAVDDLKQSLAELSKQQFDMVVEKWNGKLQELEHNAERLNSLISRRNAYASDHVSISKSNNAAQENIGTYQQLITNAQKQINKKTKEYQELVATLNDKLNDPNSGIKKGTEAYNEMLKAIYAIENEIDDLNSDIIEYSNSISEEYMRMFNNVVSEYEGKMSLVTHLANEYNTALQKAEAKGLIATESYYEKMKSLEEQNLGIMNEELKSLQDAKYKALASGEIEIGSNDYYEMNKQIADLSESIMEAELNIIEFNNSIREVQWKQFDYARDAVSDLNNEIEFLNNLLDDNKLFDDKGKFTNEGMTKIGLHGTSYNVLMAEADKYGEEVKRLANDIANDPANTTLIERQKEMLKNQQDLILSANRQKDSIVDLVEQGINKEISSMKELIKNYTDALSRQKSMYDYQKKIAEQTKNITNLEKQLSAYQNDISEETKSKIQKIKVDLESARRDLDETQFDHYISEQKKILDDLMDEFEKAQNARLDDVDALIREMITAANKNAITINDTLHQVSQEVGYTMTGEMESIWSEAASSINGTTDAIAMYGENFSSKLTTTNSSLNAIDLGIQRLIDAAKEQAVLEATRIKAEEDARIAAEQKAAEEAIGKGTKVDAENAVNSSVPDKPTYGIVTGDVVGKAEDTKNKNKDKNTSTSTQGNGKVEKGDKVTYVSGVYHEASDGSGKTGSMYKGKNVYITKINSGSAYPYHISTGKTLGSGDLGWLKKSQISGYSTGLHKSSSTHDAFINEKGNEYIVRPSDNAILTKIKPRDSVITPDGVENLWKVANNPTQFIAGAIPNISGLGGKTSVTNNLDNITFNLPNVTNYEEFLYKLQHDKRAERLVQAMTTDVLAGNINSKHRFNF